MKTFKKKRKWLLKSSISSTLKIYIDTITKKILKLHSEAVFRRTSADGGRFAFQRAGHRVQLVGQMHLAAVRIHF